MGFNLCPLEQCSQVSQNSVAAAARETPLITELLVCALVISSSLLSTAQRVPGPPLPFELRFYYHSYCMEENMFGTTDSSLDLSQSPRLETQSIWKHTSFLFCALFCFLNIKIMGFKWFIHVITRIICISLLPHLLSKRVWTQNFVFPHMQSFYCYNKEHFCS